jgi:hypothetical protein
VSQLEISVVIPVFNRGELIRYTLESVRRASVGLAVETIIVDDGSDIPVAESIAQLGYTADKIIRRQNRGLLFARLTGLANARGRYVLFLDSDDLISPDKLRLQLAAMERENADVSYTDSARCEIAGDFDALVPVDDASLASTKVAAEFFITVQPAPHSPIFRTAYLKSVVAEAPFPPLPLYNPVAEIWFYSIAACRPASVVYVPGPRAIVGSHPGTRLTNHWERLGVASLAVQEGFAKTLPNTQESLHARQLAAEKAFTAWRRLPRGFSREFCARQLALWHNLHRETRRDKLGGRGFSILSRILGLVTAARLLQLAQNMSYARNRTMDDASFQRLLSALPPP